MADQVEKVKRPASQYYWGDWFKDVALQTCSLPARGLWHEMNCLMHQGEPYGHLTMPNGKPMQPAQLANLCKVSSGVCKKLIQELEDNGVLSRAETGAIYSRRMVRDEASRELRAEIGRQNGVKGKEFGALGAEHGAKGGRPATPKNPDITPPPLPGQEPPNNPLPSSSSASASASASAPSGLFEEPNGSLSTDEPLTLPACPHGRVIDLFAKALPTLPKPKAELWQGAPAEALRARWKWLLTAKRGDKTRYATNEAEALDWLSRFFEHVGQSDFLMGRNAASFKCTLQWLVKAENFAKVVQGNYNPES